MALDGVVQRLIIEMERYCSYQERSSFQVKTKLLRKGATESQIKLITEHLISKNFLNEPRFVEAYVQGKSRIKQWGAQRIKTGLLSHNIPDTLINRAISSLTKEKNHAHLKRWIEKKQNSLRHEEEGPKKRAKIIRFLISKGFSLDEIFLEL